MLAILELLEELNLYAEILPPPIDDGDSWVWQKIDWVLEFLADILSSRLPGFHYHQDLRVECRRLLRCARRSGESDGAVILQPLIYNLTGDSKDSPFFAGICLRSFCDHIILT